MSGRRWSRAGLAVVALGAVAFAVLAGVAARRVTAPDDEPKPATVRIVQVGDARLAVPADWAPARSGSTGLDAPRMVVLDPSPGLKARVVAVFGPADDASLVPAALRAQLRSPPARPRTTSLGGRPAWAYPALATRDSGVELNVTVLPTTAGVLTLACTSPADEFTASDCGAEVRAVSVRGGATLRPSPVIALAARLPAVLAELDRERAEGRAALARARTPERQAVLAQDLARQHLVAASSLPGRRTRRAAARRRPRAQRARLRGARPCRGGRLDHPLRLRPARDPGCGGERRGRDRRRAGRRRPPYHDVARTSPPRTADEPMRVPVEVLLALAALLAGALLGFVLSGPSAVAAGARRAAPPAESDPVGQVGDEVGRPRLDLLELEVGDPVERALARSQHERDDVQAELVDQARREVLETVAAPPAMLTSRSPAAARAWASADSIPSVTKWTWCRRPSGATRAGGG